MKENFCDSLMRVIKAASFGFLGATAIIHITSLVRPIIRESENRYLSERHHEFETTTLLIVGFLTLIVEPVIYIVNLAKSLEYHGLVGLLWLASVVISQSYAFTWGIRQDNLVKGVYRHGVYVRRLSV